MRLHTDVLVADVEGRSCHRGVMNHWRFVMQMVEKHGEHNLELLVRTQAGIQNVAS